MSNDTEIWARFERELGAAQQARAQREQDAVRLTTLEDERQRVEHELGARTDGHEDALDALLRQLRTIEVERTQLLARTQALAHANAQLEELVVRKHGWLAQLSHPSLAQITPLYERIIATIDHLLRVDACLEHARWAEEHFVVAARAHRARRATSTHRLRHRCRALEPLFALRHALRDEGSRACPAHRERATEDLQACLPELRVVPVPRTAELVLGLDADDCPGSTYCSMSARASTLSRSASCSRSMSGRSEPAPASWTCARSRPSCSHAGARSSTHFRRRGARYTQLVIDRDAELTHAPDNSATTEEQSRCARSTARLWRVLVVTR